MYELHDFPEPADSYDAWATPYLDESSSNLPPIGAYEEGSDHIGEETVDTSLICAPDDRVSDIIEVEVVTVNDTLPDQENVPPDESVEPTLYRDLPDHLEVTAHRAKTIVANRDHTNSELVDEAVASYTADPAWPQATGLGGYDERKYYVNDRDNPTFFAKKTDYGIEEGRTIENSLDELIIAPEVKEVINSQAAQAIAREGGFDGISFVEPLIAITDAEQQVGAVVFRYEEGRRPVAEEITNVTSVADDLQALFEANGLQANQLRAEHLLIHEGQLKLIDTECYAKIELPASPVQADMDNAVTEIKSVFTDRQPYTMETATEEKPYTHYTKAGNLFQILRFGIQSENFKTRINAFREEDPAIDSIAPQMTGFRAKKGGSYQGVDSISLDQYGVSTYAPPGNVTLLVDPNIRIYGARAEERDKTAGYGHGIVVKDVGEGFKISNPTAYPTEVLAANIIPPSAIKAVAINDQTSILAGLRDVTRENVKLYSQARLTNPQAAAEDLLANARLLANLSGSPDITARVDQLAPRLDGMKFNELVTEINVLQRTALQELVGKDTELTEASLRGTIQKTFNITFLAPAS